MPLKGLRAIIWGYFKTKLYQRTSSSFRMVLVDARSTCTHLIQCFTHTLRDLYEQRSCHTAMLWSKGTSPQTVYWGGCYPWASWLAVGRTYDHAYRSGVCKQLYTRLMPTVCWMKVWLKFHNEGVVWTMNAPRTPAYFRVDGVFCILPPPVLGENVIGPEN